MPKISPPRSSRGWTLQQRLHELAETTYRASAQRNATLIESLTGIETIKTQGAEALITSPDEFQKMLIADVAKWARVVKQAGILPE